MLKKLEKEGDSRVEKRYRCRRDCLAGAARYMQAAGLASSKDCNLWLFESQVNIFREVLPLSRVLSVVRVVTPADPPGTTLPAYKLVATVWGATRTVKYR